MTISAASINTTHHTEGATARAIPSWLAPIVEHLELTSKPLVTLDDIREARPDLSRTMAMLARAHLIRHGWLQPTGMRGTYEFIPGAAAGPYPSGDPWLHLRALLAHRNSQVHVGAESAAWLSGYAQRSPDKHVLVVPPHTRLPRILRQTYHVVETAPAPAHGTMDGLPVPTKPELFAELAQLAPRLHLDAARAWVCPLLEDITPEEAVAALRDRGPAVRARAGYFAASCDAAAHATAIAAIAPIGNGPFYTGPRSTNAAFSHQWRVYDTGHFAA